MDCFSPPKFKIQRVNSVEAELKKEARKPIRRSELVLNQMRSLRVMPEKRARYERARDSCSFRLLGKSREDTKGGFVVCWDVE